jgi:hypothetical protein
VVRTRASAGGMPRQVGGGVRRLAGEQLGERQRQRVHVAAGALVAAIVGGRAEHDVAAGRPARARGGVLRRGELDPRSSLAIPKSMTLAKMSPLGWRTSIKLEGLMSRWITPASWT